MSVIVRSKDVLDNKPRINGTRIGTETIWNCWVTGWDVTTILSEFPRLSAWDISAALRYEHRPTRCLRRWLIARSQPLRAWLCERLGGAY